MSYEKQIWIDGESPLNAERFNHIEEGIAAVADSNSGGNVDLSITGATAGQTVKISAVDETGAPTAWEAVEWPVDGKFELLNTITVQEDGIQFVKITEDQSGKNLDVKAVFVRVVAEAAEAVKNGYVFCYGVSDGGNEIASGYIATIMNTTKRTSTFIAFPLYGYWQGFSYGSATTEGNNSSIANYPAKQCKYSLQEFPYIKRIQVNISEGSFTEGTKIEIWGVRA